MTPVTNVRVRFVAGLDLLGPAQGVLYAVAGFLGCLIGAWLMGCVL